MSDADAIEQFKGITGVDDEQAKFYLDSAGGDMNAAMSAYLENAATDESESPAMPGAYAGRSSQPAQATSAEPMASRKGKAKSKPSRGGINTLGGLQQDEDDEDDDDDRPAEFYTGGEKSGLGVIDPTKKKDGSKRPTNLIQDILKKAALGGQTPEEAAPQGSNFRGGGYTLGGEDQDSRRVDDPNEAFRQAMASQPPKVTRTLRLWKDGFSVDDGRLYRYDDPANKDYLEAINNGRAPLALLNVEYGQAVDVNVEKRVDEAYTPPPKVYKPFEGSGHRLGSDMPPTAATPTASSSASGTSTPASKPTMEIDESKPTTSLQIRLASGGRLVSQFNTTHTVADLYDFIERAAPSGGRAYVLLTPFPRREYPRDDTTIESAGLLKGVVQQKFT